MDEGLGELDPLLHPGRVAAHRPVALLVQADVAEDLGRPLAGGRAREAGHPRHVADEVGRRGVRREAVVFGHVADELADGGALRPDVEVHHGRVARRRRQQPEEDLDERALACAVGADEPDDPGFELEGEAVEGGDAARVALGQVMERDQCHGRLKGNRRRPGESPGGRQRNWSPVTIGVAIRTIASGVPSADGSMATTSGPASLSMTVIRVVPFGSR